MTPFNYAAAVALDLRTIPSCTPGIWLLWPRFVIVLEMPV